jgi:uncharacterized protein (TIGR02271 family)
VRGWTVAGSGGAELGKVDDLLVDTGSMSARYLVVTLSGGARGKTTTGTSHMDATAVGAGTYGTRADAPGSVPSEPVLVPVSRARIDDRNNRVHLDSTGEGLAQLPRYTGRVAHDYHDTFGRHEQPGRWSDDQQRLTRSAEELRIGKRQVKAGEVNIKKHVETEKVKEPVTRMREDVHIERRPASGTATSKAEIREDEVRVPIAEEELVVEKRPVLKEELVISKERKQETETVEADLRKERIDVDRSGSSGRGPQDEHYGTDPKRRGEV